MPGKQVLQNRYVCLKNRCCKRDTRYKYADKNEGGACAPPRKGVLLILLLDTVAEGLDLQHGAGFRSDFLRQDNAEVVACLLFLVIDEVQVHTIFRHEAGLGMPRTTVVGGGGGRIALAGSRDGKSLRHIGIDVEEDDAERLRPEADLTADGSDETIMTLEGAIEVASQLGLHALVGVFLLQDHLRHLLTGQAVYLQEVRKIALHRVRPVGCDQLRIPQEHTLSGFLIGKLEPGPTREGSLINGFHDGRFGEVPLGHLRRRAALNGRPHSSKIPLGSGSRGQQFFQGLGGLHSTFLLHSAVGRTGILNALLLCHGFNLLFFGFSALMLWRGHRSP